MIKVDSSFYESGCTMEGKGNRVILKEKDGKAGSIEMIFSKDEVRVITEYGLQETIIPFKHIEKICTIKEELTGKPILAIKLKE